MDPELLTAGHAISIHMLPSGVLLTPLQEQADIGVSGAVGLFFEDKGGSGGCSTEALLGVVRCDEE